MCFCQLKTISIFLCRASSSTAKLKSSLTESIFNVRTDTIHSLRSKCIGKQAGSNRRELSQTGAWTYRICYLAVANARMQSISSEQICSSAHCRTQNAFIEAGWDFMYFQFRWEIWDASEARFLVTASIPRSEFDSVERNPYASHYISTCSITDSSSRLIKVIVHTSFLIVRWSHPQPFLNIKE